MREIKRLLSKVPNGLQRIVRQTEELLFVSQTPRDATQGVNSASTKDLVNNSDVSKLYSFPAGTHVRPFFALCVCVCVMVPSPPRPSSLPLGPEPEETESRTCTRVSVGFT